MEEELRERIEELEDRVDELEGREHRRKVFGIVKLCIKLVILGLVIFGIWKVYSYVNNIIVKPLNNVIESTSEITNTINFSNISDWFKSFN
jgi:hypothetical protein